MINWITQRGRIVILLLFLGGASNGLCSNDSLLSNIYLGYYLSNDDNPFANTKPYQERRRDDHGLTLSVGFHLGIGLRLTHNLKSNIRFTNSNSLYTKGLFTTSTIDGENPYYDDYKYLLTKHPDWNAIHVHDQIAYSKGINQLEMENVFQSKYLFGLKFRRTLISSGEDQYLTTFQRSYHRIVGARNYYHVPFVDSTIFGPAKITYFSAAPMLGFTKAVFLMNRLQFKAKVKGGIWINFTDKDYLPKHSPFIDGRLTLGRSIKKHPQINRLELDYGINYEPKEVVQIFANPGTKGYHYLGVHFHITNAATTQRDRYFIFTLTPYSLFIPIGNMPDITMGYRAPDKDLNITESFFNLSVRFVFNE